MDQIFLYAPANIFFIIKGFGTYFSSIPILASGLLYKRVKMEERGKYEKDDSSHRCDCHSGNIRFGIGPRMGERFWQGL
jgi:hypothetical protein